MHLAVGVQVADIAPVAVGDVPVKGYALFIKKGKRSIEKSNLTCGGTCSCMMAGSTM